MAAGVGGHGYRQLQPEQLAQLQPKPFMLVDVIRQQ
jgi:hypothetical protein